MATLLEHDTYDLVALGAEEEIGVWTDTGIISLWFGAVGLSTETATVRVYLRFDSEGDWLMAHKATLGADTPFVTPPFPTLWGMRATVERAEDAGALGSYEYLRLAENHSMAVAAYTSSYASNSGFNAGTTHNVSGPLVVLVDAWEIAAGQTITVEQRLTPDGFGPLYTATSETIDGDETRLLVCSPISAHGVGLRFSVDSGSNVNLNYKVLKLQ